MFDNKLLLDKSSPLWLVFLVRNPQPIRTCGVKERGGAMKRVKLNLALRSVQL